MSFWSRLNLRRKLMMGFAAVFLGMLALGVLTVTQLGRIHDESASIVKYNVAGVRDALLVSEAATRYRVREFRLLHADSDASRKAFLERLSKGREQVAEHVKRYEAFIATPEERALFAKFTQAWAAYTAYSDQMVEKARAGQTDVATRMVLEGVKPFDEVIDAAKGLADYNDKASVARGEAAAQVYRQARTLVIVLVLAVVAAGFFLGWLLARSITRQLQEAVTLAEQVAEGDLTHEVDVQGNDEVAQLRRALSVMVKRLRTLVSEVRHGVESVSTASSEIATGNLDLSSRTEQAASSLQQTASSMEELTGTVTQSADTARQANQLASSAASAARRGGDVVQEVVTNMAQITQSSRKIADIITVIDGIAFQTNILALNAAVEAARAGEQGRGFAVVAGEVRTLAQRSAQAAREIKTLIGASVDSVESGARLVNDAGEVMQEIVSSVQRVTDLMGEISAASSEQRDGIGQVNQAVTQLDHMTQQNAALVEESTAAAGSLREQAQRLTEVVSVFKIDAVSGFKNAATALSAGPVSASPVRAKVSSSVPSPRPAPKVSQPKIARPVSASPQTPSAAPSTASAPPVSAPSRAVATSAPSDDDWETF